MGKILYKGEINIVAGNVTQVSEGTGGAEGRLTRASLTLNIWDPESREEVKTYLTANAWNSKNRNMADRAKKAIRRGDFFVFVCGELEEDTPATDGTPRLKANIIDFQRNWKREFVEGDNRKTVLVANIGAIDIKEDKTIVRLPIDVWSKETSSSETQWIGVSFKNGKAKGAAKLEVGAPVAILGGKIHETVVEERNATYYNMAGFEFIKGYKNKKEESANGTPSNGNSFQENVEPSDFAELDIDDSDLPF